MRAAAWLCALSAALAACGGDEAPSNGGAADAGPPEARAFDGLVEGAPLELVPTAPGVAARCAAEVTATYCDPSAARAAAIACRARLTDVERDACDPERGCLAPYAPTRGGSCAPGPTYPSRSACATPVADDCAFYRACLDPALPCGATGYALGFGEPLCHLFVDRRDDFTPDGRRWLVAVRSCLQRELAALASRPPAACGALADAAYASHTRCYTAPESSFCALPPADLARLARMLSPYLADPRAAAQVREVTEYCAARRP